MSSETDIEYVHMQFHDTQRVQQISSVKEEYDVTWKEMVEYGSYYLDALDDLHTDDPEFLAELLLRTDLEATLTLDADADSDVLSALH